MMDSNRVSASKSRSESTIPIPIQVTLSPTRPVCASESQIGVFFLISRKVTLAYGPYVVQGVMDYRTERLEGLISKYEQNLNKKSNVFTLLNIRVFIHIYIRVPILCMYVFICVHSYYILLEYIETKSKLNYRGTSKSWWGSDFETNISRK